jgi:hypothetical protein
LERFWDAFGMLLGYFWLLVIVPDVLLGCFRVLWECFWVLVECSWSDL